MCVLRVGFTGFKSPSHSQRFPICLPLVVRRAVTCSSHYAFAVPPWTCSVNMSLNYTLSFINLLHLSWSLDICHGEKEDEELRSSCFHGSSRLTFTHLVKAHRYFSVLCCWVYHLISDWWKAGSWRQSRCIVLAILDAYEPKQWPAGLMSSYLKLQKYRFSKVKPELGQAFGYQQPLSHSFP